MKWRNRRKQITRDEIHRKAKAKGVYALMLKRHKREPSYSRPRMGIIRQLVRAGESSENLSFARELGGLTAVVNKMRCDFKRKMKRGAA